MIKRMLLIIGCILALTLIAGCNTPESKYQELVTAINKGELIREDIGKIEVLLQESEALGDKYKDNEKIKLYLEANKALKENKLNTLSVYLFINIPEDYSGDIAKGINQIREVFKEKAIPEIEKLIKEKKYTEAKGLLNPLKDTEEFSVFWNYVSALEEIESGYIISGIKYLYKISYYYEGPMAKDIKRSKTELESDPLNKYTLMEFKPEPALGMTSEEVERHTGWGIPEKKNISTGSYGVHEQWVYGYGKYLYLEDGIVTDIEFSK